MNDKTKQVGQTNATKVIQKAASQVKVNPIVDVVNKPGVKSKEELAVLVKQVGESEIKETQVVIPEEQVAPEPVLETLQEVQMFQQYKCSKPSMRMMTSKGKKLYFIKFELLTQDEDIIEYLDYEITQNPRLGITKGAMMSLDEKDPMAALKRQHIAEYIAEQAKKASDAALGITRDMGTTDRASHIMASHSGNVAN